MRRIATIAALLMAAATAAFAQQPELLAAESADSAKAAQTEKYVFRADTVFSDIYLDTVQIKKKFFINDYDLVGVQYGPVYNTVMFNPTKNTTQFINPLYVGVTWTHYCKMFGYMPYFGLQTGLFYGTQGYKFKTDKDTGVTPTLEGATQAVMHTVELPVLAQMHMDVTHFKVMAQFGFYGGYRTDIERTGDNVAINIRNEFLDTDIKFDFGLKGGVGFGLVFDPFEFHLNALVKYSWSSLYEPDYYSKYYYRYAYPLDVAITAGIHYQLTRRSGKTSKQIRKEAYDAVFGTKE